MKHLTVKWSAILLPQTGCVIQTMIDWYHVAHVCQENVPHSTTTTSLVWTVDPRQVGFMDPCSWCQILLLPSVPQHRNWDSSDQASIVQSSALPDIIESVQHSYSFLFLTDGRGTQRGLMRQYNFSNSRFNMLSSLWLWRVVIWVTHGLLAPISQPEDKSKDPAPCYSTH